MSEITIYTDGACSGNPGPGGWAALVIAGGETEEVSGGAKHTTNQRMELTAALEALKRTPKGSQVALYSDSAYLINAFRQRWTENWQRNGWLNARRQPVENQDLWRALLDEIASRRVTWHKVKGHADSALNNRCDALARAAIGG
ncbi:MAG TPA: ribonuclease HI [Limnochordia bacterium]|nr:ribonuclease HI [Limnochordia bacterium]